MNLSQRAKFWMVTLIIVLASCFGGIFGNWIFIYFMDAYYGIPAGYYGSEPLPVSSAGRNLSAKDFAAANEAVALSSEAEASLVGIFQRLPAGQPARYLPKDKAAEAVVLTADGWLLLVKPLPQSPGGIKDFVVVTSDQKTYDIDRSVSDSVAQVSFLHLAKASNLPARDFRPSSELSVGQNIFGIEWRGTVERGLISRLPAEVRSSDRSIETFAVSGLSGQDLFLFDGQSRLSGFMRGPVAIAADSVRLLMDKVLAEGAIRRPALGLNYLNLAAVANTNQSGWLLAPRGKEPAVVAGGAAARGGLQAGDIITRFDNLSLGKTSDLALLLAPHKPGDTVVIEYSRQGEARKTAIVLDQLTAK